MRTPLRFDDSGTSASREWKSAFGVDATLKLSSTQFVKTASKSRFLCCASMVWNSSTRICTSAPISLSWLCSTSATERRSASSLVSSVKRNGRPCAFSRRPSLLRSLQPTESSSAAAWSRAYGSGCTSSGYTGCQGGIDVIASSPCPCSSASITWRRSIASATARRTRASSNGARSLFQPT